MVSPLVLLHVSQGVGYLGLHERLLRRPSENILPPKLFWRWPAYHRIYHYVSS